MNLLGACLDAGPTPYIVLYHSWKMVIYRHTLKNTENHYWLLSVMTLTRYMYIQQVSIKRFLKRNLADVEGWL